MTAIHAPNIATLRHTIGAERRHIRQVVRGRLALALGAVVATIALGSLLRATFEPSPSSFDPQQVIPYAAAGGVIAAIAALRPRWRIAASRSLATGIAVAAWATALLQQYATPQETSASVANIFCVLLLSLVWLLWCQPLAAAQHQRHREERATEERLLIVKEFRESLADATSEPGSSARSVGD